MELDLILIIRKLSLLSYKVSGYYLLIYTIIHHTGQVNSFFLLLLYGLGQIDLYMKDLLNILLIKTSIRFDKMKYSQTIQQKYKRVKLYLT